MTIKCVRDEKHIFVYHFRKQGSEIQKIGQFPSLADIANDEISALRKTMDPSDAREFHKAIGLAAHGVGVGSFVYLRRVFERLVYRRFEEVKADEGWEDEDFYKLRMEEKIELLRNHLPDFLVASRKIYSILSVGVHELDEKECLSWFGVMKKSIQIILQDDAKKREEAKTREEFSGLITSFKHPK